MIPHEGLTQLIRKAQTGDRQRGAELLQRVLPTLERFAERYGDVSTAAESASDLLQEASWRVCEKIGQFQGTQDDCQTAAMLHDWLEQLVRRLATNRREARHAQKRRPETPPIPLGTSAGTDSQGALIGIDPAGTGPSPSAVVAGHELESRVRAAFDSLPDPTDRQILELCFMHSLSLRAVAEHMQLSYDQVRERYHAGLRRLEQQLEGLL
ncbi:MAG: RNA polymerase sigma factor [Planctomycetales bacterium]